MLKRLLVVRETRVWSLGQEDPLEKAMAPHSRTLAWKIPWMEEPGGLQSTGSQRLRHDWMISLSLFLSIQNKKLKNKKGINWGVNITHKGLWFKKKFNQKITKSLDLNLSLRENSQWVKAEQEQESGPTETLKWHRTETTRKIQNMEYFAWQKAQSLQEVVLQENKKKKLKNHNNQISAWILTWVLIWKNIYMCVWKK